MKKKHILLSVVTIFVIGIVLLYAFGPITGPMPLWMSVLPPLIAIAMALIVKEVLSSLFIGVFSGAFIMALYSGNSPIESVGGGLLRVVDTYITGALFDHTHIQIVIFTLLIGGMIRIISANGGMHSIVQWMLRRAKGARSGQLMTFLMDLCIFFDDYSNVLMVGNTMRPVADKLKISRQKLAFIIDSTAAPVVAIAFVTTWIGAELSYIQSGIDTIGIEMSAYSVFFQSLKYSFYPILTLGFVLMIILSGREYGPMLKAEKEARIAVNKDDDTNADIPKNARKKDALIPLFVLIFGTIIGLIVTGYDAENWHNENISFIDKLSAIIGNASSYKSLQWASLLSLITAMAMTVIRGTLPFSKIIEEMIEGFKMMFNAILILTMAWAISMVTADIHTAEFVSNLFLRLSLSPYFIPAITFILGAFISFSTGSSWGAMAILYPLILPATWILCMDKGFSPDATMPLFYNVVASVMAGSVMGDHCSPISDTTIMSSMSAGCNHIDHVQTQMPYALTVGATSLVIGVLPTAFGLPSWIAFPLAFAVLYLIIKFLGKKATAN